VSGGLLVEVADRCFTRCMRVPAHALVLASSLGLAALVACASSGSGPGFGGGTGQDGGSGKTGSDATIHTGTDGGTIPQDGGSSSKDGGSSTHDGGGSTKHDAGGPPPHTDGGTPPGGPINFDGGWHPPDSGTQAAAVGSGGTTVVIGPGANATSAGKFGGPATGPAPTLVYPADGVMLPPNVSGIEFEFLPGAGQTLFELSIHTPTQSFAIYTSCTPLGPGCVYVPDAATWASIASYARGTQPVTYTLLGVNGASPAAVGTTATQTLAFSDQDLSGGIYYWNTSGVIERYDLANPSLGVEDYLDPIDVGALVCVGCHVLSRDGYRIVAGRDIPAGGGGPLLDVPSKMPININGMPGTIPGNFFSFSPDGQHILTSAGVSISWLEIATGQNHASVAPSGTMPDWSPDGLHMVFAQPSSPAFFATPGVDSAAIGMMHFNGTTWDTPTTLVPFSGQNNYYPAYSPDGSWVVFNRSPSNADSFSNASPDNDAGTYPDGQLWLVSAAGGTAVQLSNAGAPTSWPKWAPVVHTYYDGKLMWLTFSSARAYGLRLAEWAETQLWMVAIDPARIASGHDASFPPFWLPFQDIGTGNHIAQWSTAVRRASCSVSSACPSREVCKSGTCVPG